MLPVWVVPVAGFLGFLGVLIGGWPRGERPGAVAVVVTVLVVLATVGFGAAALIALTQEG